MACHLTTQKNFWDMFLAHSVQAKPREWLWIDSNSKNGNWTSHIVILVMNFRQSVTIAELWRAVVARHWKKIAIFCLFGKMTPYGEILKILFWKDSSRQWSTCCVRISWSFANGKSVKSCIAYLTTKKKTQNFALLSRSCYCADCAQNPTGPAPDTVLKSAPDFIQIGSLSAELCVNVWTPSEFAPKSIQYLAEA